MQEEREHKGLFGQLRSLVFEDVPVEDASDHPEPARPPGDKRSRSGADDVDKMFADIEAEVGNKGGQPAGKATVNPITTKAPIAPAGSAAVMQVLPPDVQKFVKLIEALPSVLTPEQVQPLLAATMDAASLNGQSVSLQVEESQKRSNDGIAGARQEIVRLEAEREETLARLAKLMEAARTQCSGGVTAQQARIAELSSALATLNKVSTFLPAVPVQSATERKP